MVKGITNEIFNGTKKNRVSSVRYRRQRWRNKYQYCAQDGLRALSAEISAEWLING